MAQHTITVPLTVNDTQYIEIIKAQQRSGKRTVETFLKGLIEKALDDAAQESKKPKSSPEIAKAPKAKKAKKPETAKEILAAAGFTMPSDAGAAAEIDPAGGPAPLLS